MKRTKGKSPLQRSLELLRENSYVVEKVEQYVQQGMRRGDKGLVPNMVRKDVFGLFDILGVRKVEPLSGNTTEMGAIGVQCCAYSGISNHKKKALEMPMLLPWLQSGNAFVIHGWYPWTDEERRYEVVTWEAYLKEHDKIEFVKAS